MPAKVSVIHVIQTVYLQWGGDQLLLNLDGDTTNGFTTSFNVGLDRSDTEVGASDINTGGPGGGPSAP